VKVKLHWPAIFVGVVATLVSLIAIFSCEGLFEKYVGNWDTWKPATSMMADGSFNFNELVNPAAYIRQPWNTFSSLYYVFVGAMLLVLPYTKKVPGPSITSSKSLRWLYGVSVIITGLGSAFMHMSATFIGQTTDVVGMYLVSVFIVMYALRSLPKYTNGMFTILYIVINVALFAGLIFAPNLRRNLFLALILIGLVLEYFCNRKTKGYNADMLLAAACSLAFAYIVWQLDNYIALQPDGTYLRGIFFNEVGFFQGHPIWHLGGATACGLLFSHYSRNFKAAHPELV